jgi:hypothetical protein
MRIRRRKCVFGAEHPDTLATRHCVAYVKNKQGKYKEALEILTID